MQWKAFDRERWNYLRRYRRLAYIALNTSIQPVIELMNTRGVQTARNNLGAFVNVDPITDFYANLYRNVGDPFGRREVVRLSQINLKQDDSAWVRMVQEWTAGSIDQRVALVEASTIKELKVVIDMGIAQGYGVDKIAELMRSTVGVVRATRIARTEIISASNLGSLMGAKSTELPLNKEWLATQDNRTRLDHLDADGQTVGIDDLFTVSGELLSFAGDWTHGASAGNVINCRCTQTYTVQT